MRRLARTALAAITRVRSRNPPPRKSGLYCLLELPAELRQFHAMFCRFACPDVDHGNIAVKPLAQNFIFIDIHFVENGAKLSQKRGDCRFGFLAEMAAGTCVQGDVARPASGQARILGRIAQGFGSEYFINGPECG